MYRSHGEQAEVKPIPSLCKTEIDVLRFSIHSWGTSSFSVRQLWSDILLFKELVLLSFNISNIPKSRRTSWSQTDAFIVQDWNRCTEIQYPLFGHIFNFSTTAVKRQSTFQGILVLHLFIIFNVPKSRRTSWSQTDAFIVQDWNRCTEIQYPILGHFFIFSTTAVKCYSTFQGIIVLHSFIIFNIPKSQRTSWSQHDAFIVQDWNRCTEIQDPILGHFFILSTTAVKW